MSNLASNKIVILIHGLMRTPRSMKKIADFLMQNGYEIQFYGYSSTRLNINNHSKQLLTFLKNMIEEQPSKKFHIVTHSLGGILAREALACLTEIQQKSFESLTMLCPPNKGSHMAAFIIKLFPLLSLLIKPLPQLVSSNNAYIHQVGTPIHIKIGIIAAKFDAKTPPSMTQLDCQNDFIVIKSNHTFILNHKKAMNAILSFIKNGSFD